GVGQDRDDAMRIWNLMISVPFLGLGLIAWRFGDWTASAENDGMDGTCRGLQQDGSYLMALGLFALSIAVIFSRGRHFQPVIRAFVSSDDPAEVLTKTGEMT